MPHFHIELLTFNLNYYKKFDQVVEKSTVQYENLASLLITPSKDSIPHTWTSEGKVRKLVPFLFGCDEISP